MSTVPATRFVPSDIIDNPGPFLFGNIGAVPAVLHSLSLKVEQCNSLEQIHSFSETLEKWEERARQLLDNATVVRSSEQLLSQYSCILDLIALIKQNVSSGVKNSQEWFICLDSAERIQGFMKTFQFTNGPYKNYLGISALMTNPENIQNMSIKPDNQVAGVGSALEHMAEEQCTIKNLDGLIIKTACKSAITFFKHLGFVDTGHRVKMTKEKPTIPETIMMKAKTQFDQQN